MGADAILLSGAKSSSKCVEKLKKAPFKWVLAVETGLNEDTASTSSRV